MFLSAVDCGRTLVNPDLMFDKTRRVNRMRVTKRLMIPGKKQGSPATFNSIAEIRSRVIHQNGTHPCVRNVERLRLGQPPKVRPSGQLGFKNRKIRVLKLDRQHMFDAPPGLVLGATVHTISSTGIKQGIKQGFKNWQTIDVVPMPACDQQVGSDRL